MNHDHTTTSNAAGAEDHARDRLLAAAHELLTEAPLNEITVRRIAERAGVAHSLITPTSAPVKSC